MPKRFRRTLLMLPFFLLALVVFIINAEYNWLTFIIIVCMTLAFVTAFVSDLRKKD